MTDTVQGVEGKRPGEGELETTLEGKGEGTEGGCDRGALEVPPEEGSSEVSGAESVETSRKGGSGEALPDRTAEPGLLLVVDIEVGGYGTLEALLGQDLVFVLMGEFLRCYLSVRFYC